MNPIDRKVVLRAKNDGSKELSRLIEQIVVIHNEQGVRTFFVKIGDKYLLKIFLWIPTDGEHGAEVSAVYCEASEIFTCKSERMLSDSIAFALHEILPMAKADYDRKAMALLAQIGGL